MTDAISVVGLSRVYQPRGRGQGRTALDTVSLAVREGETHGLLGPNGAGKTTLVKILATLLAPTSGRASVLGHDVVSHAQDVRRAVGLVLGGDRGHYTSLTAEQNLRYWAAMYGYSGRAAKTRVRELLERFGLAERAGARVETFSRGMKQRLHLARGLVGDSPVLILDEPTAGMDPLACREFREITRQLGGEGRTILITTHDMAEAQELCDRVTLISGGRLLATEQPAVLAGRLSRFEHVDVTAITAAARAEILAMPEVATIAETPAGVHRISTVEPDGAAMVLACLLRHGITGVSVGRPSLTEIYVELVGGDLRMKV